MNSRDHEDRAQDIAVVGMAARFPGAPDLATYWQVIAEGRDTITRGPDLVASIPAGPEAPAAENFVAARGVLPGVEDFDAGFWGYTPREAATLDPQHRLWLELAHEALESAGYARTGHGQVVAVFAGSFLSSYLHGHLIPTRAALEEFLRLEGPRSFGLMVQNDPAFLPSRSAYKLNLRGPAINVQTGCSTSLVAIAQATQSLLSFESDIALAGGVCIALPQHSGYFYQEGGITSRDGFCRPYDSKACGTVFGSGGGAVALKRLADAERDGDPIHAVIRGAAVNNDGVDKVSFHAPSVAGQAEVITTAQALADVEPRTIGYIEGHGTATPMGDPIEVEALTQAFRRRTTDEAFCCLGSVKGNVGHLDAAAGVAGFIRAVLALRRQVLPPTAHFETPNPSLPLSGGPFFVLSSARPWPAASHPRRAGVSSFGIGGTNAHVVLEEYLPGPDPIPSSSGAFELRLSAKEPAALEEATKRLAEHMAHAPEQPLASIAETLRLRREEHASRRSVLVRDHADAIAALSSPDRWHTATSFLSRPKLAFAFPGQGSLRLDDLARLVAGDEHFARRLAEIAGPASDLLSFDLTAFCRQPDAFPDALAGDNARAQTALYCVCVALANCLRDIGIAPDLVLGHSVGEWPAAYACGQVSAEDGLRAVFHRGRLMSTTGRGAALSVKATEEQIVPLLIEGVTLACVNGPSLCLLSGRPEATKAMSQVLRDKKIRHAAVPIDVAVHSPLMDPAVPPFAKILEALSWREPALPMLSSVTGAYFPADAAANRHYFSRQLRAQVRFDRVITTLLAEPSLLVLEVGVATTITALLTVGFADSEGHRSVPLLPAGQAAQVGDGLRRVPGLLWCHGLGEAAGAQPPTLRAAYDLPTYPFQRKRYWVDAPAAPAEPSGATGSSGTADTKNEARGPGEPAVAEGKDGPATDDDILAELASMVRETAGIAVNERFRETPFVALGMDSLLLMQLSQVVKTRLRFAVTFRQLVQEYATPGLLEDAIRSARSAPAAPHTLPQAAAAAPDATRREIPPMPAQLEMWRVAQSSLEASCADNESLCVWLKGALDEAAMQRAFQKLTAAHEALHTHFSEDGTRLVIEPEARWPLEKRDLSHLPPAERTSVLHRLCVDENRSCFALVRGPLCRATLVCLDVNEWALVLSAHRSVCDGWSLDVVLEDLGRLYSAVLSNAESSPFVRHGLSDFIAWRASDAQRAKVETSLGYWTRLLADTPPALDLVPSRERQMRRTFGAVHVRRALGTDLVERLCTLARDHSVSVFSVMVSGIAAVLRQRTRRDDFVLGIPVAGHPEAGLEDAVGCFASVAPLRVQARQDASLAKLAQGLHGALIEAQANAMVGLEEVEAALPPAAGATRPSLVNVVVSHARTYPPGRLVFGACEVSYRLNARSFERYDLNINVIEAEGKLELLVHGNSDILDEAWLAALTNDLEAALRKACSAPEATLVQLAPGAPPVAPVRAPRTQWKAKVELPITATLQRGQPGKTPLLSLFGIQLYIDVATAITDGTPVVGLHVPILYVPGRTPRPPLDVVVRHYLDAVRSIQPLGPYQLAGFCFGGLVAYEVARMLEADGERVDLVVVIDSVLPHGRHINPIARIVDYAGNPRSAMERAARRLKKKVSPLIAQLRGATTPDDADREALVDLAVDTPDAAKNVEEFAASRAYIDTHLLGIRAGRPDVPAWDVIHPDMGWTAHARSTEFCAIPSNHLGILRPPHAEQAAQAIMRAMENARRERACAGEGQRPPRAAAGA